MLIPRVEAIERATEALLDPQALYLDTETTGLGPEAEIVQIALLDWRGEPILDVLVKPTKPIGAQAMKVHGITNEAVADRPEWRDTGKLVNSYLREASRVIAYNAPFDFGAVAASNLLAGLRTEAQMEARWQCAMRAFSGFRWGSPDRRCKLAEAAAYFGYQFDAHDALNDARAACRVIAGIATGQPEPERGNTRA